MFVNPSLDVSHNKNWSVICNCINARLAEHIISFLAKRLINSIIQEYQC